MATQTKDRNKVVAREAIVINVGARPIEYQQIEVTNKRTGLRETIENHENIVDPGDEGIPYAFKEGQKVLKTHPAVKANPGAFMSLEEFEGED